MRIIGKNIIWLDNKVFYWDMHLPKHSSITNILNENRRDLNQSFYVYKSDQNKNINSYNRICGIDLVSTFQKKLYLFIPYPSVKTYI